MQVCLIGFSWHVAPLISLWIPAWTGRLLLPTEELLSHGFELVRLYSYLSLSLVLLLVGLRSCLPGAIRAWLEDPTDGLAALWNDPVQLAAAASPAWETLRWLAALLNVCWVGLSLCAFHCHGAQDGALFHGHGGGERRVPALMVVLVVLSSGVLVCMLALLARMGDEGAVSGADGAVPGDEAEGGRFLWAASEKSSEKSSESSPDGLPPRERSVSHGPYGPSLLSGAAHAIPSGGAPLPPYHSAHRAVLLAALPAGIACALTLAPRVWPTLNTALAPSAWLRGWRGGRGAVLGAAAMAAAAVDDAQDGAHTAPVPPARPHIVHIEELLAEARRALEIQRDALDLGAYVQEGGDVQLAQRTEQLTRLMNEQSLRHDALHAAVGLRVFDEALRAHWNSAEGRDPFGLPPFAAAALVVAERAEELGRTVGGRLEVQRLENEVLRVHRILQDPSVPPGLRAHFAMRFGVGGGGVGGVGGVGVGGAGGGGGGGGGGAGRANDADDRLPVPPVDSDADSMDEDDDDMEDDNEWDS